MLTRLLHFLLPSQIQGRRSPARTGSAGGASVELVFYTRPGCGLCEEMKAELERARTARPFHLREVDISGDPELEAAHGRSIPVLEILGRAAFKGRLTAADFERVFARRLTEAQRRGSSAGESERGRED